VTVNPLYFGNTPIGFFDGVAKGGLSGVGVFVKIDRYHCFKAHMAIGSGTNIRAELLALWVMLFLCKKLELVDVHIAGDSKMVVDWFNQKAKLHVMTLQPWKDRINELVFSFATVQIFHIHRQFNSVADVLSKEGLSSEVGLLKVEEFIEEEKIPSWIFNIF